MRDQHDTTTAGPTVTHPARLALLEEVRATVAGRFGRRESRQSFWDLVTGLLMGLPCANCWTVAEAVGHRTPYRLQHLVSRAVWDADAVLAAVAGWVTSQLDGPVILVVDETGDAKASTDAVGAASQYSGSLGGMGVCQVAVHLSLATPVGHAVIGRRLYLGADWAGDEERRTLTGVPEEVMFATKPDLAIALLREAVTAGTATKGAKDYEWALLTIEPDDTPTGTQPDGHPWPTGHSVLLARRHRYTRKISYFRAWTPHPVPLTDLVTVVCARWHVEEDFQISKRTVGLDQGQVRIPITCPELQHLLATTLLPPPPGDPNHIHHCSRWRRHHQATARRCHQAWNTYADQAA